MRAVKQSPLLQRITWGALFGLVYVIIGWLCYRRLDPDFGWHLQAGRFIVAHGIPAHDIFSYTAPNFPWIDHEWLSDVIISQLYRLGGMVAVAAVFAAAWTGALVIAARRQWAVAALATVGLVSFITVRPLAFTALLLATELAIWYRLPKRQWLLIPLFLVWANLHAGFSLGLIMLALMLVWERRWRSWWILVLAAAVTFINPYGPRLYVEVWRTLSDASLMSEVTEWGPLQLTLWAALYIVTALFGMIWRGTWRRTMGLASIGLLIAAIASARQYMPFVVVSLPLVAEAYAHASRRLAAIRGWLVTAVATAMAVLLVATFVRQLPITNHYPVAPVAALRQQPCSGHIFNNYNFGGYLDWQLPGVPVYIDGRMPSWKSPSGNKYIDRYFQVLNGGKIVDQEFRRYDIRCAILYTNQQPLSGQLRREGWKVSARDSSTTLWRKPD